MRTSILASIIRNKEVDEDFVDFKFALHQRVSHLYTAVGSKHLRSLSSLWRSWETCCGGKVFSHWCISYPLKTYVPSHAVWFILNIVANDKYVQANHIADSEKLWNYSLNVLHFYSLYKNSHRTSTDRVMPDKKPSLQVWYKALFRWSLDHPSARGGNTWI